MRKEGNPQIPYVGQVWPHPLLVRQKLRKHLGSFLRSARGDLTFAQFEKKMGISGSTLHRIELGQQNVTLDTLEAIMDRLKVTTADIFDDPKK
jgi:DNA-binding Xre family transcriptional regulator